ncbi:MAG: hypothetical protein J5855_08960 [Mailhella sp.]|nr:hypothetical protein [Mailhella sp.]
MQGYRIHFKSGCEVSDIRNLYRMTRLTLEELRGRTRINVTCHHSVSDDGRTYEVNLDNPNARDLAIAFIGTARRILGEDCCRVTPICQA